MGNAGVVKNQPGTQTIQCTLCRSKPVKAAIIVFGNRLEIVHDPQLVTETEAAVLLKAGDLRLGLISVYLEGDQEITPYLTRIKKAQKKLEEVTNKIIVAGDVYAWSPWWGSISEDSRGEAYSAFLNEQDLHIQNIGNTPTFETVRGGVSCTSFIDVTACSRSLLGYIEDWFVNRNITTSDHNAITFSLHLAQTPATIKTITTRRYKTRKAKWGDFGPLFTRLLEESNISLNQIEKIDTPEQLEEAVNIYTTIIHKTCDATMPSLGIVKQDPLPPWWSKSLNQAKKEVLTFKRRIRNAAPSRRKYVIDEYIRRKEDYKAEAEKAQTDSWRDFCTNQDKESMWDKIYRVLRKTNSRHEDSLLRCPTTGDTLTPQASADLLAYTFYPDDSTATDHPCHRQTRKWALSFNIDENLPEDDPQFTPTELETVLKSLNPKKAPGPDGLTADICSAAIRNSMETFLAIANKCLSLHHFPNQWKIAHVVIIRKPGKEDYTHPKSYRPIGLLSVLGKIVEKLLVGRLQWHILPKLNKMQYGFLPQRGTEDALSDLIDHIQNNILEKKSVLMVSLDIEGAFDNAWWPALKYHLAIKKCPRNLFKLVNSYLRDRKIKVNYARKESQKDTTKGCVQGSIAGPTFWNVILDSLLHQLNEEGVYCQAFADDVVLIFASHNIGNLEQQANKALRTAMLWGNHNKLSFAPHKTNAMILTKKLKYDSPIIQMAGIKIQLVKEIKLLGVIIDRNMSFKSHVTAQCRKAADIYKRLACTAKVTWGLNSEIIRTIYVAIIEPIITYGASAWFKATELRMIQKQLNMLQRGFAQKICRSYRTVSHTSALILSGLLPLDIRIQEQALIHRMKIGKISHYLPPNTSLETNEDPTKLEHPALTRALDYDHLDDTNPEPLDILQKLGPTIFTDGSKINEKVGAALTWWEQGKEKMNLAFTLHPSCTVFQAELYAIYRATQEITNTCDPLVTILSDSRSSLDLLRNPRSTHPLANAIQRNIQRIREQGREVKLTWLRAHIGTAGNERADELAKNAALSANPHSYVKTSLAYIKTKIREESILRWQDRYTTSSTGATTKEFLPDVIAAFRITRTVKWSHILVQILTGHGGFASYLHRFKLKETPGCECDPSIEETVWHIILDCPRFSLARMNLETLMNTKLERPGLASLIADNQRRPSFLKFLEDIFQIAMARNGSKIAAKSITKKVQHPSTPTQNLTTGQSTDQPTTIQRFLCNGHISPPGLKLRPVALFMDEGEEKLGFSFCVVGPKKSIYISPGLAALTKGCTSKTTMRKSDYESMPIIRLGNWECRIVRTKNKTIALFDGQDGVSPFTKVCKVLDHLGTANTDAAKHGSRTLSVDVMKADLVKGAVTDLLGCIPASVKYNIVVYEDRGQDLAFLRAKKKDDGIPSTSTLSGAQRLERKIASEEEQQNNQKQPKNQSKKFNFPPTILKPIQKLIRKGRITRADKGQVTAPDLSPANDAMQHMQNAFLEYTAIVRETIKVNLATCEKIRTTFELGNEGLLRVLLEEEKAAIYDNNKLEYLRGNPPKFPHMAAYSGKDGFVYKDDRSTVENSPPRYATSSDDPILVIARCTEVALEQRILNTALTIQASKNPTSIWEHWEPPDIKWVNGVPGCGKSTWVVNNFIPDRDLVATTTTEAAEDLRSKIPFSCTRDAKIKVRTIASILVNSVTENPARLFVDEALMNHFGAIVMAAILSKAKTLILIGDINQLPFIDRLNLFQMHYIGPNLVTTISQELARSYRCPMDVTYALNEVYNGIYSARQITRSLRKSRYTGASIPIDSPNTLYLVHTQAEKADLTRKGYGKGENSRTLTINESQGLTYEFVVIIQTKAIKNALHDSISHAIVALTRHTKGCIYYTDAEEDAIGRFIRRANEGSVTDIVEHNIKMAISYRDEEAMDILRKQLTVPQST